MLVFLQVVSRARMSDDIDILALANFCLAIQLGRMATELQVNRKFTCTLIFYYFHVTSLPVHHVCSSCSQGTLKRYKWKPWPLWLAWRLPFLLMSWSKQRLHHYFHRGGCRASAVDKVKIVPARSACSDFIQGESHFIKDGRAKSWFYHDRELQIFHCPLTVPKRMTTGQNIKNSWENLRNSQTKLVQLTTFSIV